MDFKERKEALYSRFGLKLEKIDEKQLHVEFKNSILNYIDDVDLALDISQIRTFCGWFGVRATFGMHDYGDNIKQLFLQENNFIKFLFLIESLLSFSLCGSRQILENSFFYNIKEVVDNTTLPINIEISRRNCIVYPKRCAFLDDELITKTLKFLNDSAHEHFISALKDYTASKYIKSAEHVRRCFEEFLKYKRDNKKGLKQNIQELTKINKSTSPPEIRNIITQVSDCLDKLFNEHSKHNDGLINENECEYIIYQVAVLIRYIDKINR